MTPLLAQLDFTTVASAALFYAFAAVVTVSAVGVVVSSNIVRTSACLLFALGGVAGLYVLLSAEFLAAVQLVVYVGGTLILIIFGVMLTSKTIFQRLNARPRELLVAGVIGAVVLAALVTSIVTTTFANNEIDPNAPYPVGLLGASLIGDYLIPFELVSVLLLVVMIGAAYLAKSRKNAPSEPREGK